MEKTHSVDQSTAPPFERPVNEGPPNTEKSPSVDQNTAARFERVRSLVLAQPALFATQGSVVAGWRAYRGRQLGPYFRLAYRDHARQRSVYLGRCVELARRVRDLLTRLQRPHRQRRLFARLVAQVRASLRRSKAALQRRLALCGIQLKGFEFRGTRRALASGPILACWSGQPRPSIMSA